MPIEMLCVTAFSTKGAVTWVTEKYSANAFFFFSTRLVVGLGRGGSFHRRRQKSLLLSGNFLLDIVEDGAELHTPLHS